MSYNPARVLGIDKGNIDIGYVADITIFDPQVEYRINPHDFVSKGKNTPFTNMQVRSKVIYTIKDGRVSYSAD